MATGGGMSRSLVGSSDVFYDFPCSPCAEDGKNTEAIHFCENCDTNFCQRCVAHHNKVFKLHKLLDQDTMKSAAKQTKQRKGAPMMTEECGEHPGNTIQMFCGTHDVCRCTVCIALEHRTCKNVDFIPKVAKGILKGKERQTAKTSLKKIQEELVQLRSKKEEKLFELKKTKTGILKEIKQHKERVIARVNEFERKSIDEVCERYQDIDDKITYDIDSLNELLKSTEVSIDRIETVKSNESELFIAVKHSKKLESTCAALLKQVKHDAAINLSFKASNEIVSLLNTIDTFGNVTMTDYDDNVHSPTLIGEYDVKVSEDKETCRIYDLCVLDNNQYIVTDLTNNKIKRLDKSFRVTDWFTAKRGPWGVCKTGANEVAVTLCKEQKVMIITFFPKNLQVN